MDQLRKKTRCDLFGGNVRKLAKDGSIHCD
jgi:hypothetical protein